MQELPSQEAPARSGLLVEEIRSGFVVAPDLKLTSIDGSSDALAGLYGGFITDRRLLLGAAAYWLTGGAGGVDMAYGGGLVEWFGNPPGAGSTSACGVCSAPAGRRSVRMPGRRYSEGCTPVEGDGRMGEEAMPGVGAMRGAETIRHRMATPGRTRWRGFATTGTSSSRTLRCPFI